MFAGELKQGQHLFWVNCDASAAINRLARDCPIPAAPGGSPRVGSRGWWLSGHPGVSPFSASYNASYLRIVRSRQRFSTHKQQSDHHIFDVYLKFSSVMLARRSFLSARLLEPSPSDTLFSRDPSFHHILITLYVCRRPVLDVSYFKSAQNTHP